MLAGGNAEGRLGGGGLGWLDGVCVGWLDGAGGAGRLAGLPGISGAGRLDGATGGGDGLKEVYGSFEPLLYDGLLSR